MYTGTALSAGTNSGISIEIWGTDGHIGQSVLTGTFERGDNDTTNFDVYFGNPYRIKVYHDGSGWFSGWKLDKVALQIFDRDIKH